MKPRITLYSLFLSISLLLLSVSIASGEGSSDATMKQYKGWDEKSEYNSFYDYRERDSLKGKIRKFKKITPLKGMAPGTAFILDEGDEEILVHLCPWDFASPDETGIRKGVKTKVKGCWALINGEDVFIAAKVKQGDDFSFKVRLTKDGKPFWTMSKEELKKERGSE